MFHLPHIVLFFQYFVRFFSEINSFVCVIVFSGIELTASDGSYVNLRLLTAFC